MDAQHLNDLKRKARVLRDQKIDAAKREYQRTIESIDQVARLEDATINGTANGHGRLGVRRGSLVASIKEILPSLPSRFTTDHVLSALMSGDNPPKNEPQKASISNALKRFVEADSIAVVVEPAGRRSGVFTYLKGTNENNNRSRNTEGPRCSAAPGVPLGQ